jgi:hypothetical protein
MRPALPPPPHLELSGPGFDGDLLKERFDVCLAQALARLRHHACMQSAQFMGKDMGPSQCLPRAGPALTVAPRMHAECTIYGQGHGDMGHGDMGTLPLRRPCLRCGTTHACTTRAFCARTWGHGNPASSQVLIRLQDRACMRNTGFLGVRDVRVADQPQACLVQDQLFTHIRWSYDMAPNRVWGLCPCAAPLGTQAAHLQPQCSHA